MPQLGILSSTHTDVNGNALVGSSVNIYREGSTVSGAQSGASPFVVTVRYAGKIQTGDAVFINNITGSSYSATRTSETVITLSGFGGTLALADKDRIVPSSSQPTLYSDDQGGATQPNPLTTDSNGFATAFIECGIYDSTVTTGSNVRLIQSRVAEVEACDPDFFTAQFSAAVV
jgi:hypothetical protein